MEKLALAVVGCGRIAQLHLRAATQVEALRVVTACDANRTLAKSTADAFQIPNVANDLEEVCRDDSIKAALVCLPHLLHAETAIRLALAGKHILIEKPLGRTVAECDAIIECARASGVRLMVGHVMRFSEQFGELRRAIAGGKVGKLVSIRARRLTWHEKPAAQWWTSREQCGGLALPLIGSHILDTIFWMLNVPPKKIFALGRTVRPQLWEGEDEADLLLKFENEFFANISLSMNCRVSVNDLLIVGDKDSLLASEQDLVVDDKKSREQPLDKFVLQLREFADAVLTGREPAIDGNAGRRVVAVMEAAQKSMNTGREIEL